MVRGTKPKTTPMPARSSSRRQMASSASTRSENPGPQAADQQTSTLGEEARLGDALDAFHRHMLSAEFSANTIKAFRADLRLFLKFLPAETPLGRIEQPDLERFLKWMREERGVPCSPKTYARRLTTLKVFFSWLEETGAIPSNPAEPLAHERPSTPLPQILEDYQAAQLLRTARDLLWAAKPDARPYLLVTLLLQTGIKKSECMAIRLEDIDLSNEQQPVLRIRYDDSRRSHKERRLLLGPGFTQILRQYLREQKPQTHLFECTARNLEYVLEDIARLARLEGGVSFEQLRWTCAVRDFRTGMPVDQLREKLGLSQISWRETLPKIQKLARPTF